MNKSREDNIKQRLIDALKPNELELIDESYKHVGHAGAQTGLSHYHLIIQSDELTALSAIDQHRAIYDALGSLIQTDIHALRITVK